MMTVQILEIILGGIMVISILGTFYKSIKLSKGIGARAIQLLAVSFIIPTILILAFEKVLTGETVATLIGGITGYILSGIGKFQNSSDDKS